MKLSVILNETRQKLFMTQEEFATELGVTASTINRWEHSKARPNMKAMKKLRELCDENSLSFNLIEKEWLNYKESKENV